MAKMANLMKSLQRVEEILNSEGFPLTVAILAKMWYLKKLKFKKNKVKCYIWRIWQTFVKFLGKIQNSKVKGPFESGDLDENGENV